MEPKIREYLESMEGTIKHLKSMVTTSKIKQVQASNYVELRLRDRDVEKDGAEKALFPVQCLPAFHTKHFTGREEGIDSIHERLGSTEVNRLQTYLIYGRRGIGKTQVALEYSRRCKESYDSIFWNHPSMASEGLSWVSPGPAARLGLELAEGVRSSGNASQKALSETLNKDLPIGIKGKRLDASADTGSDECCMPKDVADHLGLQVRCGPSDIKVLEIGDGRKIKSIGRATVGCSFWNEPGRKL
jgi:hypothetical protein